jgi:hypothetical protein
LEKRDYTLSRVKGGFYPFMVETIKSKTFSMVASICSFVVAAFASISAIYDLVNGIKAFGDTSYDTHITVGIFDLLEMAILILMVLVCILLGLKLLAGSKLALSTNPIFRQWFICIAGLYEIDIILNFVENAIFNTLSGTLYSYLIVNSILLIGCIVMMFVSKSQTGLNVAIFFFIGIGCLFITNGYLLGRVWYSVLSSLAFWAFEVMAVLACIFEDNLNR